MSLILKPEMILQENNSLFLTMRIGIRLAAQNFSDISQKD